MPEELGARVAIITRTLSRPLTLRRAMASVLSQSYRDWCWVVVNDGGASGPVDYIAAAASDQAVSVKVIHHAESAGMEAASNAGIAACRSEYIVIHDDDDTWEPEFLSQMVDFLDARELFAGVVCHTTQIDEEIADGAIRELERSDYNSYLENVQIGDMVRRNQFPPISFLFRRAAHDAVGPFDETLPVLGDWDFALRMLMSYDIGVLPSALANYHLRPASDAPDDAYGNTLYSGIDTHVVYDAVVRNKALRQDLASGKLGLGVAHPVPWTQVCLTRRA